MAKSQSFTARWIFPVDTPPLANGVITVEVDKIIAVAPHGAVTPDVDLGQAAILPGFVNAHTHLDLSRASSKYPPPSDFTQWLRGVIAFRRTQTPEQVNADIAAGIDECVGLGTTLIGDISATGASWNPLARTNCRAVVFRELIGLTKERADEAVAIGEEWSKEPERETCLRGLSPHAPYSVRSTLYSGVGHRQRIATHLAETIDELKLLQDHSGPFVDFLKELGVWSPEGLVASPSDVIRLLPHGIFVHCNYLDPTTPFAPTQSLVVCPYTHAAFHHPPHPFPHFLQRGVRVAIGTDSLASNPDLDILAEARFLFRHYPEVAPSTILRMLTLSGAEALGFGDVAGSLTPGKSADLVVLPLLDENQADPHELLFDSDLGVSRTMFRGEWRV